MYGGIMNIFKALKKEGKFLKRFYISMGTLFVLLPLSVYMTNMYTAFYMIFLLIIELLIVLAVISKRNATKIRYSCNNNRLKITSGLFSKENLIFCDKVVLVHTEKMEDDIEIYIFTTVNFKNKRLKLVGKSLLKRIPSVEEDYLKVRRDNPGKLIYFQQVKRGGLKKYMLLDTIYKNCVKAVYTDQCIENIKIARGQTLV